MRLLLILIVAAFAGCGVSPDDSVKKSDEQDDMHTAADEAQESSAPHWTRPKTLRMSSPKRPNSAERQSKKRPASSRAVRAACESGLWERL